MKNQKHELEQYYKGEDSWQRFVNVYKEDWEKCKFKEQLLSSLNNDLGIAQVVYGILEEDGLSWVRDNVPALDNLMPIECVYDENLKKRLKVLLTRFPI